MDVGVHDLNELAEARPDLGDTLEPAIMRLKEALAPVRMYGDARTDTRLRAEFGPVTFGSSVDDDNIVLDVTERVSPDRHASCMPSSNMTSMRDDSRWMTRWLLNGQEYLTTPYDLGLWRRRHGLGQRLQQRRPQRRALTSWTSLSMAGWSPAARWWCQPGELPPMYLLSQHRRRRHHQLPATWDVTDMADNEVSVVAARDAGTAPSLA